MYSRHSLCICSLCIWMNSLFTPEGTRAQITSRSDGYCGQTSKPLGALAMVFGGRAKMSGSQWLEGQDTELHLWMFWEEGFSAPSYSLREEKCILVRETQEVQARGSIDNTYISPKPNRLTLSVIHRYLGNPPVCLVLGKMEMASSLKKQTRTT